MQSAAVAFSPSPPSGSIRKLASSNGLDSRVLSPSFQHRFDCGSARLSSPWKLRRLSSRSLERRAWIPDRILSSPDPGVVVRASSEKAGAAEIPDSKNFVDTLVLGSLFGAWYLFNIYFNIYNKQV
ncbi:phosphate/phosphoenolpyruvate translocator [Genlisea aurea]|uniref:Phosphate/phosphoenolpyruvate translocator n=1 Tax=Genlisea aurea TaxID=192259 RepID=S8DHX8_9LAMI|nr:phosphate/phosphoenolpyruvate translocator [Genlisea aurea]